MLRPTMDTLLGDDVGAPVPPLTLRTWARSRAALQLEVLALRHQLQVLQRTRPRRLRLAKTDRWLWVVLSRLWTGWRTALVIVKPETVIAWHRRGFRLWWTWKSRRRIGRPTVPADVRTLIRTMARGEPAVGRAADSRRTAETRDRRLSGDRREIHGPPAPAAVADVAHVLAESQSARSWRPISSWSRPRPTASCSSWCSSRTIGDASGTWPSPRIRRRRGRPNSCARPFRGTRRLDT